MWQSLKEAVMEQLDRTWSNDEAAAYIGCTPQTLRVWVSRRKVPFVRIGRLVRFRRHDLDVWMDQNLVPAGGTASERRVL
jgi:excisionase family DNA binding protein